MKKFLAISLALVMVLALSVTCFAETVRIDNDEVTNATKTVTAEYVGPQYSATVFGVDVEFGSMEFKYTAAKQGTWNPSEHDYTGSVPAGWSCETDANKVTVTNHSNVDVTVTVKYEGEAGGKFGENATATFDLAMGELNDFDGAATNAVYLTLVDAIEANNNALGTVTVTIAEKVQAGA